MAESRADPRQRLGREGERAAEETLRAAGLTVVARRFRTRQGEIDLIGLLGSLVVFVEVKTRRGWRYGSPARAITPIKRKRLARVAGIFLQRRGWLERPCRFDVVEVVVAPGATARVRHIPDAFRIWPTG